MVMVTFGTGVGGGIILDGKILNGAHGVGGEIGHIVVNRDEPVACTCGKRGCVEQYASAPGICRAAQQALATTDAPSLLRRLEPLICKDIFACAAQGDAVAAQVLDRTFAYMGEFLADVCCVIDRSGSCWAGASPQRGSSCWTALRPTSTGSCSTPAKARNLPWPPWATPPGSTAQPACSGPTADAQKTRCTSKFLEAQRVFSFLFAARAVLFCRDQEIVDRAGRPRPG